MMSTDTSQTVSKPGTSASHPPQITTLRVANLQLDTENPRFEKVVTTQDDALAAMLKADGAKTLTLARSIASNGLSPFEPLAVIPIDDDPALHRVVEGNRRLTALRLLRAPDIAGSLISASQLKLLRDASKRFLQTTRIEAVACVVLGSREEADQWIARRHGGDLRGEGIVPWGALELARFKERRSKKPSRELQVIEFVRQHGHLDEMTRGHLAHFKISNLKRLLSDQWVLQQLGLTTKPKEPGLFTRFSDSEILAGLTQLVSDIANQAIKVSDIYTSANRKHYLSRYGQGTLPSGTAACGPIRPLVPDASAALPTVAIPSSTRSPATSPRAAMPSTGRACMIPRSLSLEFSLPKIEGIFNELRKLKLEDFPNAASVLLRVFLELSLDAAIERDDLMEEQQRTHAKLADKLRKVTDHLRAQQLLTTSEAKAMNKASSDKTLLCANVSTMHQYVHNNALAASPTDLRVGWDNIQPLIVSIWNRK